MKSLGNKPKPQRGKQLKASELYLHRYLTASANVYSKMSDYFSKYQFPEDPEDLIFESDDSDESDYETETDYEQE